MVFKVGKIKVTLRILLMVVHASKRSLGVRINGVLPYW